MCHLVTLWNFKLGFQIDLLGVPCGKSIHVYALIVGLGFQVNNKMATTTNEMVIISNKLFNRSRVAMCFTYVLIYLEFKVKVQICFKISHHMSHPKSVLFKVKFIGVGIMFCPHFLAIMSHELYVIVCCATGYSELMGLGFTI
jgi:hypothetical protein